MKLRIVILFIAIILGAVAVIAVLGYVNSIRASVAEEVAKVEVLVAVENIPRETTVESIVSAQSMALEAIPRKYLADGVLTSVENYMGYVVAAPINRGQQVTSTSFIKPEDIGMSFVVPSDMVAVSIPVNEVKGTSNLINIGDFVNVIATFQFSEEEQYEAARDLGDEELAEEAYVFTEDDESIIGAITKTVLWNVEVLYIGKRTLTRQTVETEGQIIETFQAEETTEEIRTVTLALTPEDSERIVFSEEMGLVWLALVPMGGIEPGDTEGCTFGNVFDQ